MSQTKKERVKQISEDMDYASSHRERCEILWDAIKQKKIGLKEFEDLTQCL